jgi:hypothetical protein
MQEIERDFPNFVDSGVSVNLINNLRLAETGSPAVSHWKQVGSGATGIKN